MKRKAWLGASLVIVGLAAQAGTAFAAAPGVATGAARNVGQLGASLRGTVDPNRSATTYFFQYGTTRAYGASTPERPAGAGDTRRNVAGSASNLAPATEYHYRLVARNADGTTRGADRVFRTQRQPLGVTLGANPNPIAFGSGTVLSGTLTGTGNGGQQVVLQDNPFPYSRGFANVGNPQVTDGAGRFSFALLSVPITTQYRVRMPARPAVVSPIVTAGVAVRVSTRVSRTRIRRGSRVRFSGTIRPARDGAQIAFQKRRNGRWVTIGGTITRHGGSTFSRYSRLVRIARGGTFRVFAGLVDGNYVSGTGRTLQITTRR
jgi:hypothetical protein